MTPYSSLCDDFGVYVYVNTKMELPTTRETVLHFFDSLQKTFPQMTDFDCREKRRIRAGGRPRTGQLSLGRPRRPALQLRLRQPAGPGRGRHSTTSASWKSAPYHLDFSALDCEALDVLFAFDFLYSGNHDEVVAEALGLNTTLESLMQMPGTKVLGYEPSLMLSLDETCRLQCRLSIETRTNAYQIRTGQFPEAPISVYFTVRQYWGRHGRQDSSARRTATSARSARTWWTTTSSPR